MCDVRLIICTVIKLYFDVKYWYIGLTKVYLENVFVCFLSKLEGLHAWYCRYYMPSLRKVCSGFVSLSRMAGIMSHSTGG